MNPVRIHTLYIKIHCNITLPSTPTSSKWSLPSGLLTTILYVFLISPLHTTFPTHLILHDLLLTLVFGEEYRL